MLQESLSALTTMKNSVHSQSNTVSLLPMAKSDDKSNLVTFLFSFVDSMVTTGSSGIPTIILGSLGSSLARQGLGMWLTA